MPETVSKERLEQARVALDEWDRWGHQRLFTTPEIAVFRALLADHGQRVEREKRLREALENLRKQVRGVHGLRITNIPAIEVAIKQAQAALAETPDDPGLAAKEGKPQ